MNTSFGAAVKGFRSQLGISQEMLAERAGLDRTYVGHVERGARNVSLSTINKLAAALKISTAALLSQAGERGGQRSEPSGTADGCEFVDILMVEDRRRDVELTLAAFKKANVTNVVHVVSDGAEALDYLFCSGRYAHRKPAERPQLILLDLKLPKVSGLEVLRRLKQDKRTRAIPVVVLTASEEDRDIAESRRLGADTYIVKPVDIYSLVKATPSLNLKWGLFKPAAASMEMNPRPVSGALGRYR